MTESDNSKKSNGLPPWPVLTHSQGDLPMSSPFTRRLFLGAAAALPATAAAAAAPALLKLAPAEDARLLELGQRIDPLLNEYRACADRRRSARALAESLVPPLPPEIISSGAADIGFGVHQCDVEGKMLYHDAAILDADLLESAIERGNYYAPPRTKFGKKARARLKAARDYEAKRSAAIERSGISQAVIDLGEAAMDLELLAYEVREIAPATMAGAVIQARALAAYAEAEQEVGGIGKAGSVLGRELAAAVLRLSEGLA